MDDRIHAQMHLGACSIVNDTGLVRIEGRHLSMGRLVCFDRPAVLRGGDRMFSKLMRPANAGRTAS